jgi:DnaK suppressor protein
MRSNQASSGQEENMKTENLTEHRRQLLQRLEDVETAAIKIKMHLAEEAELQTSILTDFLDHAREQSDLNAHYEMFEKYITERNEIICALDRINNGTFGECDDCGAMIADKRLAVKPSASLCLECQHSKEVQARSVVEIVGKQNHSNLLFLTLLNLEAANYEKTNQNNNPTFYNFPNKFMFINGSRPEQDRRGC